MYKDAISLQKNYFFWAFFNKSALKEQKLSEKDVEWRDYQSTIEKERSVAPTHQSGIKPLKPQIMTHLKINQNDFGDKTFSFMVKKTATLYRLLGSISNQKMSQDGSRHVLVDFCWHWPKGPGH